MKHVLFAIATIATLSAQAGQPSRLQADNNKKYNTYALYESDVKSVSILVDYKMVKTDCHGLNSKYTVTKVTDGQYLVTKDMLAHALFVCPVLEKGPTQNRTVQTSL